jgi:hypothetical protein
MRRATTSFPTPVSPVIKTFASERAAQSMSASMERIASLCPRRRTSGRGERNDDRDVSIVIDEIMQTGRLGIERKPPAEKKSY